jgi:aromatic ring hydroxylase
MTGTQFGQRMLHSERYYAGEPESVSADYHDDVDKAHLFALVKRALAEG